MQCPPPYALEPAVTDAEIVDVHRRRIAGFRRTVRPVALRDHVERTLPEVQAGLRRAGVRSSGPPVSLIRQHPTGFFEVIVGFPVGTPSVVPPFVPDELPGGPAVQVLHPGPVDSLLTTYDRLCEWLSAHRMSPAPVIWEEYLVTAATTEDPQHWWTRIMCPLPRSVVSEADVAGRPGRDRSGSSGTSGCHLGRPPRPAGPGAGSDSANVRRRRGER